MKHVFLTISALVLLLIGARASACSCADTTLTEQLDSATLVALVRIESVHINPATKASGAPPWNDPPLLAEFEALALFKGALGTAKYLATGLGGGDCGLALTPGSDFLVVGAPNGEWIGVSTCSASRSLGWHSILHGSEEKPRWGEQAAYLAAVEGYLHRDEPIHDCIDRPSDYVPWDDTPQAQARRADCHAFFETFQFNN